MSGLIDHSDSEEIKAELLKSNTEKLACNISCFLTNFYQEYQQLKAIIQDIENRLTTLEGLIGV
jgi:hypothetical protein